VASGGFLLGPFPPSRNLNMRILKLAGVLLALASGLFAQDRITLSNGDVLTGTIKTMASGKVTIESPLLGEITVPLADIKNLTTQDMVDLQTAEGDLLVKRRILGIEAGRLRLEGATAELELANLDKINPPSDPEPSWTGNFKLNALWTDGNTDRRSVGASLDAKRETKADRISFDASWNYSEDKANGATSWNLTERRAGAGMQYDYFLGKRWYALGTARVLGDTFADLDLRLTAGAGLGYTMIDNDDTRLLIEAGLSYLNENYRSNIPSVDYLAARIAYKFNQNLTEHTRFQQTVEAYPSLEQASDIYLQARSEFITNLTASMIASLAHIIDYDNTPSPGNQRADQRVELSIGWSF